MGGEAGMLLIRCSWPSDGPDAEVLWEINSLGEPDSHSEAGKSSGIPHSGAERRGVDYPKTH